MITLDGQVLESTALELTDVYVIDSWNGLRMLTLREDNDSTPFLRAWCDCYGLTDRYFTFQTDTVLLKQLLDRYSSLHYLICMAKGGLFYFEDYRGCDLRSITLVHAADFPNQYLPCKDSFL